MPQNPNGWGKKKNKSTNSDAHGVHSDSTSSFKFSTSQQQSHNQALIQNLWGQFWSLWIFNRLPGWSNVIFFTILI